MAKKARNRKKPVRKQVTKRNPIARELREGGANKPQVIPNKKRYTRKVKHKVNCEV